MKKIRIPQTAPLRNFAVWAASFFLCAGCGGYDAPTEITDPVLEPTRAPLTFSATTAAPAAAEGATKTYLYLNNGSASVYWKENDQIGITAIPTGGDMVFNKPFTLTVETVSNSGSFTEVAQTPTTSWPTTTSSVAYIAVYPYQAASTFSGTGTERVMHLTFPHTQGVMTGSSGDFPSGVMAIKMTSSQGYFPGGISFSNLFSIIKLNITGSGTLQRILFRDLSGKPVSGDYTLNLNADNPVVTFPDTDATGLNNTLVLDLGTGVTLSNSSTALYLAVPPRAYPNGFEFTFMTTTGETMTQSKNSACTLECSKIYEMASAVAFSAAAPTDLSTTATANCYIVPKAGQYCFPANVIGNGSEGLLGGISETTHFHTGLATIEPHSAKLLWQDVAGLITNVSFTNNIVTFTANEQKGNAVIAVYDNADPTAAEAHILWSWHIWCTECNASGAPYPGNETYTNYAGTRFTVMNRNLGASSSNPGTTDAEKLATYGLFYQWGRKDPFPSNNSNSEPTLYGPDGSSISPIGSTYSTDVEGTIEYAIAHPTTFIKNSSGDWLASSSASDYLWGNPYGYNYNSNPAPTPRKSIYDPCPPGYRVAPRDTWTGFTSTGGNTRTVSQFNVSDSDFFVNKGWNFFLDGGQTSTTWYPAAGCRANYSGSFVFYGSKGLYWSSSPSSHANCAADIMLTNDEVNPLNNYQGEYRSYGFSIRCVYY